METQTEIAPATKVYELVEELAQYLPSETREKFISSEVQKEKQ